jgi:electron transfer flavoprotein beta subunit
MKAVVCVSLVPDSTTKVKINSSGKSIDPGSVSFIINPYDEFAVEEAVKLKENNQAETTVISFGTEASKEAIKKSFQMGIDKGILIKSDDENFDSYTAARNLADVIKEINPDIIFFGKQSIDYDGQNLPILVGALLNIPAVSIVTGLTINGNEVTAEREIEGGKETVSAAMPVIIGAQKGLNTPRYPNLKSIMASKSKPIDVKPQTYKGNYLEVKSMILPQGKGKGKIFEGSDSVEEVVRLLKTEAKVL